MEDRRKLSERYRRFLSLFKGSETREEMDAVANQLLDEIIVYFPELKPKDHAEVHFHDEEEWKQIFLDINRRRGRSIPPPNTAGYTLQIVGGDTAIVCNIPLIQEECRQFGLPMTFRVVNLVIHELIHHLESPGGPETRPLLKEEIRVIRKSLKLTDKFLDTKTSPEFVRLMINSLDLDWYVK